MGRMKTLSFVTVTAWLMLLFSGTALAQSDASNLPLRVTDLNGDGLVDCAGACDGDIYTIVDFNDALALLYDGLHHNGVKSCASDARRALIAQRGTLFYCQDGCPNGLLHAWRNADLSDETTSFLSMVGLSPMPLPKESGSAPAVIDFCNAYSDPPTPRFGGDSDFLDNDPIRVPCDPNEQVCGADGTLGLVLPIVPPTNLSSEDNYPTSECSDGVFKSVEVPDDSLLCPNGRPPQSGQCSIPVLQGTDGSIDFRCINSSNNCPAPTPSNADCRSYNLFARDQNGAFQTDAHGHHVRGAFFRIHATTSPSGVTCRKATATDQMACLTSANPDSVELAYGGASAPVPIVAAPSTGDFFETKFAKTLGFISDSYGALQAVQFLKALAGFSSSDIDQVKTEIIVPSARRPAPSLAGRTVHHYGRAIGEGEMVRYTS